MRRLFRSQGEAVKSKNAERGGLDAATSSGTLKGQRSTEEEAQEEDESMKRLSDRSADLGARRLLVLLAASLLACSPEAPEPAPETAEIPAEAISLLGEELFRPELDADALAQLESNLAEAEAMLLADPQSADALIWVGRRTGYLGRYRDAIEVFTRGIAEHPDDARFLRHRGHRHLSVRQLTEAEADLAAAAEAVRGTEDVVEPDGIPNARNQPTSTLQSNIWYHLGLARYLQSDFEGALEAYEECLAVSGNPDMLVATSYWLYLTLRRLERVEEAERILEPITADLDIIENSTYRDLLLLYRGELSPGVLRDDEGEALDVATLGYGLGTWYLVEGDEAAAFDEYDRVLESSQWAAFGYLAAEAEMARLRDPG